MLTYLLKIDLIFSYLRIYCNQLPLGNSEVEEEYPVITLKQSGEFFGLKSTDLLKVRVIFLQIRYICRVRP